MSGGLDSLAPGKAVTPNIRLAAPLGSGGMGAVWLADHAGLKTRVVVKFMHAGINSTPSARARFAREAAAAAQVKSPHVVQMLDHGVTEDGIPFIVMEHLEGRDLGQVLKDEGALDPSDVVVIVAQVAKALTKVHAAGLLHRDIKPDNIFVCDSEDEIFVKLLDFGVVKRGVGAGDDTTMDGSTNTGQVVGTPFYMSPEQVTAQKALDARSDLWALGVVAFEALTGKRPFDGPSFGALAVLIATGTPPRPTEVNPALPKEVDAWFERACARDPASRFATARDLAEGLRVALGGVGPPMSDSGQRSGERSLKPARVRAASDSGDTPSATPSFVNASTMASADDGEAPVLNATGAAVALGDDAPKAEIGKRRRSHVVLAAAFAVAGAAGVVVAVGVGGSAASGSRASDSGSRASTRPPAPARAASSSNARATSADAAPVASASPTGAVPTASAVTAAEEAVAHDAGASPALAPTPAPAPTPTRAPPIARPPVTATTRPTAAPDVSATPSATPSAKVPLPPPPAHDDPLY